MGGPFIPRSLTMGSKHIFFVVHYFQAKNEVKNLKSDYKAGLNQEQLQAVETWKGPLLIIAGAGTGKTRTLVCRAAAMIEGGIPAQNILMLTFTNKAAAEMKERAISFLGKEAGSDLTACTFHSYCVAILRKYGKLVQIGNNFTILSSSDEPDIVNMVKSELKQTSFQRRGFPPSSKIVGIISQAVNQNRPISDILSDRQHERYMPFADDIILIGKAVAKYRKANNLVNYDDLLLLTNQLLSQYPNVAHKIASEHPYIMVDEYQDTNPLQEQILRSLFLYTPNIAVVGDDMQSLYAFRGAEIRNIIEFPNRFPGCKTVYLTQNYRSSQEILDLSNQVTECATEGYQKILTGTHHSGTKPILLRPDTQYEEAEEIVRTIQELKRNLIPLNEICVLFRNSYQCAYLESLILQNKIPYVKYGGTKFFDLEHIKDILAYLKILLNPLDEIAWFRILKIHQGIGNIYARQIAASCKVNGLAELLSSKYKRKKYATELSLLYDTLDLAERKDFIPALKLLTEFYLKTKERNIKTMKTDEGNRTHLLENLHSVQNQDLDTLINTAMAYDKLSDFLDALVLDNTHLTQNEASGGELILSTIHSAKGLEFNSVIVMDCVDEVFPSTTANEIGSKADNEELRCFYVALTRAKENLYLYSPQNVMRYGKNVTGIVSHYLSSAEHLMDGDSSWHETQTSPWTQLPCYGWRQQNIWE